MDLFKTFTELPKPTRAGSYSVGAATNPYCRVGRSLNDHPVVLLAFDGPSGPSAPRRLANLAYTPPGDLEIVAADGAARPTRMAILECTSDDRQLAAYFFRVVASVLLDPVSRGNEVAFDRALDAIVTLFRAIQRPGIQTLQGLWAELAIIAWSAAPVTALSAWHSLPDALHDFAAGNDRLEVKSTARPLREHAFSLEQLTRHGPGCTLIASLMLVETDDGATVDDLVAAIADRTGPGEPLRRLEVIKAESLGRDWREAHTRRFSVPAARRDLALYRADQIPTIGGPIPAEIKEVRFVADLSGTPVLDLSTARTVSGFFEALLPMPDGG